MRLCQSTAGIVVTIIVQLGFGQIGIFTKYIGRSNNVATSEQIRILTKQGNRRNKQDQRVEQTKMESLMLSLGREIHMETVQID